MAQRRFKRIRRFPGPAGQPQGKKEKPKTIEDFKKSSPIRKSGDPNKAHMPLDNVLFLSGGFLKAMHEKGYSIIVNKEKDILALKMDILPDQENPFILENTLTIKNKMEYMAY